ncbi:MAG: transmembrane anchor protein [Pseudomonadota bacterium]
MFNAQRPEVDDLPTSRQLVKATAVALGVAGALLIAVILPAEYAIDPTGVGRALGLTQMGEVKAQLAQEATADEAATALAANAAPAVTTAPAAAPPAAPAAAPQAATAGIRSDVTSVTLNPGQGAEIKATMGKGLRLTYDWKVTGGAVNYDTHADAPGIDYHGYDKGQNSVGERGQLVASFDGKHGWFWRNRGDAPVTVTLRTEGTYTEIMRVV